MSLRTKYFDGSSCGLCTKKTVEAGAILNAVLYLWSTGPKG